MLVHTERKPFADFESMASDLRATRNLFSVTGGYCGCDPPPPPPPPCDETNSSNCAGGQEPEEVEYIDPSMAEPLPWKHLG